MILSLSARNIEEWYLWIHDRNHRVLADSMVFGSDILEISVDTIKYYYPTFYQYGLFATETKCINKENDQCLSEKEIAKNPIQQCIQENLDYKLSCTLPWSQQKVSINLPTCSHPKEYDQYWNFSLMTGDSNYIKNEAKCTTGCMRYDFNTKLHKRKWVKAMAESDAVLRPLFEELEPRLCI